MNRLVYERFGSRYGFVLFIGHWLYAVLGGYRQFQASQPPEDQRLVFVCNGNICRSPLAEAYARSLGRQSASCGLNCRGGHPADPRAIEFAGRKGLTLESHLTVNVNDFEFRDTDLIVVMEPSHIASFRKKVGSQYKLVLAGSFCERPRPYIHDPYNCCIEFFNNCENQVLDAVRGICAQ